MDTADSTCEVINLFDQLGTSFFNAQGKSANDFPVQRATNLQKDGQHDQSQVHQSPPLNSHCGLPDMVFPRKRFMSTMQDIECPSSSQMFGVN